MGDPKINTGGSPYRYFRQFKFSNAIKLAKPSKLDKSANNLKSKWLIIILEPNSPKQSASVKEISIRKYSRGIKGNPSSLQRYARLFRKNTSNFHYLNFFAKF
jgi:hypothetical protein